MPFPTWRGPAGSRRRSRPPCSRTRASRWSAVRISACSAKVFCGFPTPIPPRTSSRRSTAWASFSPRARPREMAGARQAMSEKKPSLVSIGEVMIELARGADGRYGLAFGGDTFNTAVYLARGGIDVAYATALGDDPYSDALLALASAEGVGTDLILRVPGRTCGLYLAETNSAGERSFCYWRDTPPPRDVFERPQWGGVAESMLACRMI